MVNMGGSETPEELKTFLSRMFRDPFILPFGKTVRDLLAFVISRSRYRKSWKKYELIGGSPLVGATAKMAEAVQASFEEEVIVRHAFSYSAPFIRDVLMGFKRQGIGQVTVIPLYPQASYTTTSSVVADVEKTTAKDQFFKVTVRGEFYEHPAFLHFWTHLIAKHVKKNKIDNPTLLFSAHSIPEYHVTNGDTYPLAVARCAQLVAGELGYPFEVVFQSGMRRGKWIGPDAKERLGTLKQEGKDNLVLIPVSFVSENLETLYDLDLDIVPFAINELGFSKVTRVRLPEVDKRLVGMLVGLSGENQI